MRKLDPDAIARLNEPNQGLSYQAHDYGREKYDPDTGEPYYTPSRPATLTIYGQRAETVMAIIEHCEKVAAALATPPPSPDRQDVERLPRLDEGLIEAAMLAHYGKSAVAQGIDGVDLTVNDHNWSFRDGFKRMWSGVRKELDRRAALREGEVRRG